MCIYIYIYIYIFMFILSIYVYCNTLSARPPHLLVFVTLGSSMDTRFVLCFISHSCLTCFCEH